MYSRRDLGKLAALGAPALLFGKPDSKIKGVRVGAQTYSFRDMPLDRAIEAMADIGISYAELWQGHVEPPRGATPAEIKKWRADPKTIDQMKEVRKKFNKAGVRIYAFNCSFRESFSDEEVVQGMEMAKALGTKYITASSRVNQGKRLDPFAQKAGVVVAMHNHSNLKDPEEFATPESFYKAMEGTSNIAVNLDIGHFTAANFDPIDFINKNHAKIITLHIKDRKKDQGANTPFGQGDTKIVEVLRLLRDKRLQIPANIEYEYKGADTVQEVRKCFEYCKNALMTS